MIDDIVHAVAECGGDACSVQGTALLLHAVSARRLFQLFSKNKNVATFFSGSRPGCDRPFFRSYRRSEILSISARSFAMTPDTEALQLFLFLSGHEKEPLGLFVWGKQIPPKPF